MNWKPKEVFVGNGPLNKKIGFFGNGPLNKKISRFLHNYHILGDTKIFLDPIFQEFARFIFLKNLMDSI
jgi:hypothetical protein